MRIKKGDLVEVTTGADARKQPRKVLEIVADGQKVIVEGVNRVYKHVKRGHPKAPQGGRLSLEMPIAISNVLLYCDKCAKGVRVGVKYDAQGVKSRVCRKCGHVFSIISPANPKYATQSK
ncbi:MAG: 50S ribosomal protein L24 [Planctomycetota bacterium]